MSDQYPFSNYPGYHAPSSPHTPPPFQPSQPLSSPSMPLHPNTPQTQNAPLPPFFNQIEPNPDLETTDAISMSMGKLTPPAAQVMRKRLARFVAPIFALLIIGAIAFIWLAPSSSSSSSTLSNITQQSFTNNPGSANSTATPVSSDLHVYVVGAVKHPGVYVLPAGARLYQLIAAAGGTLPQANLVALNMAAPLTDGQEVYVISNGEIPPTYQGGVPGPGSGTMTTTTTSTNGTVTPGGPLLNINTATSDQMRQVLHVSSVTAQKIIDYRTQHGPYTSVDQLLQVISRSIYDRIRNQVTV